MTHIRHKNAKQENFPVGLLIEKKYQTQIMDFYNFARLCDDVADNPELSIEEKLAFLRQKEQETDNLYLKDLITAFKQDAQGFIYHTWQDVLDYCHYSATPVGQFILDIHNEKADAGPLCAVLQITNHLQDLKYDAMVLNRVYVPKDFFKKYDIDETELLKDKSSPQLKKLIKDIIYILRLMLRDSARMPKQISSRRLRMELYIIISLTNIMLKKIDKGDVLTNNIKLNKFDWAISIIKGIFHGL